MRKAKIISTVALALLFLFLFAGCSTLGSNSSIYFSQMSQKFGIWLNSFGASNQNSNEDVTNADDGKIALSTPGNWSVSNNGEYSFDAVDSADYYIIYLYDTQSEDTSFAYMSENIDSDGSSTYSGKMADLFEYSYGLYDAEVVAYPAVGDKEYKKSDAAECDFTVTGEVPEAKVGYLWDCFTGTLGIELINIEEYSASSFPTSVQVTFTNQADSSDVITLGFENASIAEDVFYDSTQDVTVDATYAISAELNWNTDVVTNANATIDLGTVTTASNKNAMTDGYGYLNTDFYLSMDYPMVVTNFDPDAGGSAGTWYFFIKAFMTNKGVSIPSTFKDCLDFQGVLSGQGENVEFTATPTATTPGSAYSYTLAVQSERGVIIMFDGFFFHDMPAAEGTLELYEDGTFLMTIGITSTDEEEPETPPVEETLPVDETVPAEETVPADEPAPADETEPADAEGEGPGGEGEGPGGPDGGPGGPDGGPGGPGGGINETSIRGLWVENGDGTLTLSFDHTSVVMITYKGR